MASPAVSITQTGLRYYQGRWLVERTQALLGRDRCPSKDYEYHPINL
ncbi:hypothetical protein [Nostoc sp.]